MFLSSDWLFTAANLASVTLTLVAYAAGLVVSLRRWHVGMPARLGAIGFGLLLLTNILSQVGWMLVPRFVESSGDPPMLAYAVMTSVSTLLHVAALTLIVLAFRAALRGAADSLDDRFPIPSDRTA